METQKSAAELFRELSLSKLDLQYCYPNNKSKFSYADKSKIVKDFSKELSPEFEYNKWLFKNQRAQVNFYKLTGPLLINWGIGFRNGDCVNPTYYIYAYIVYNLCYPSNNGLKQTYRLDIPEHRSMFWFEHEKYYKILIQYLKENSLIPCFGSFSLDELFEQYQNMSPKLKFFCPNAVENCSHPTTIAAWAGEIHKANEYLEWGYDIVQDYYSKENIAKRRQKSEEDFENSIRAGYRVRLLSPCGKRSMDCKTLEEYRKHLIDVDGDSIIKEWYDKHKAMINNPDSLRQRVRDNIKEHHLSFAPYRDLIGVNYSENDLPNPKLK